MSDEAKQRTWVIAREDYGGSTPVAVTTSRTVAAMAEQHGGYYFAYEVPLFETTQDFITWWDETER